MKEVGLILAPEVVRWDTTVIADDAPTVDLLQRRASFTELATFELPKHSRTFGPISLKFDISKLRDIGATPVIYVPQGQTHSPHSTIATFVVNGVYHTKYVLAKLQELKVLSDPTQLAALTGIPVGPSYVVNLRNPDPAGNIVAEYTVPIAEIQNILRYIGFRNIPFDHSVAVLDYLLSLFYPTDNSFRNDQLGYYRQREWRLISSDIGIHGQSPTRALTGEEMAKLERVDPGFWKHELTVDAKTQRRSRLAVVYQPTPDWDLFDIAEEILVPRSAVSRARAILGDKVIVRAMLRR